LDALVAASGLDLVVNLAERDSSLDEAVADQLALSPTKRMERLMPASERRDTLRALRWLGGSRTPAIVIGGVAALLQEDRSRRRVRSNS